MSMCTRRPARGVDTLLPVPHTGKRKNENNFHHLPGCLIALGAPAELVSRDTRKYTNIGFKKHKPYAGTAYNNGIYQRFTKEELMDIIKTYFRESVKKHHPDKCKSCKVSKRWLIIIEAYERACHLLRYH